MRRIGAPTVSPDGRWLVYQLRETDLAANRGRTDLWLLDLSRPSAEPVRIASDAASITSTTRASRPTGARSIISATQSGSDQLWRVALPGGTPEQVTDFRTDVAGFLIAPTGDRIAIWADRDLRCADINCANVPAAEAGQGSGRTYDETFVRHWDTWATQGVRSRVSCCRWRTAGRKARERRCRRPGRRFAVQAVRRRGGAGLEPRRPDALFHPARRRADRAQFHQSRHLCRRRKAGRSRT